MLSQSGNDNVPVGTIWPYAGNLGDIPTGWKLCDGTDGTPDLRGRVLQSFDLTTSMGQYLEPALPNIKGLLNGVTGGGSSFARNQQAPFYDIPSSYTSHVGIASYGYYSQGFVGFDASLINSVYKDDYNTVQPPAYTVYFIIKIA